MCSTFSSIYLCHLPVRYVFEAHWAPLFSSCDQIHFLWTVFSRSLNTALFRTIYGHHNAGWTDLLKLKGSCSCHYTLSPARLGCLGPELLSLAHPMALAVVFQLRDFCRTCLSAKVLNFLSCEMLLCWVEIEKESSRTTGYSKSKARYLKIYTPRIRGSLQK